MLCSRPRKLWDYDLLFFFEWSFASRILYTNRKKILDKDWINWKNKIISAFPFILVFLALFSVLYISTKLLRQNLQSKNISKNNQICFVDTWMYFRTVRFLFGKLSIFQLCKEAILQRSFFDSDNTISYQRQEIARKKIKFCFLAEIVSMILILTRNYWRRNQNEFHSESA